VCGIASFLPKLGCGEPVRFGNVPANREGLASNKECN